jgi:hypothetical protein
MKRLATIAALVALALPAAAQRAQLGVKGRQPERAKPSRLEAIRTLPRRGAPATERVFPPSPLEQELARLRALQPPPRPLAPDQLRTLVRRTPATAPPTALGPPPKLAALYPRPRKPAEEVPSLEGLLPPDFVVPPPPAEVATLPNRWRIAFPSWQRYDNRKLDTVYARERWWDPFNRNTLKGDYPIVGRKQFLAFTGNSDTILDFRRIPIASPPPAANPGTFEFFGEGEQIFLRQSFRLSFDLFRGAAGFAPVDWELRVTPEFNINYLRARENAVVRADVRQGTRRLDTHIGMQELFFEKRFGTHSTRTFRRAKDMDDRGSAYFDFTSLRFGIQRFTSDFRGFIFSDEQPGARLFGTFNNNIWQYNLAFFNMLEKDTNSGLNRWRDRRQNVYVANLYKNDFFFLGWNANFSALYNNDQPSFLIDNNGFLVRPAPIGGPRPHSIRAGYVGFTSDGHIERYNVAHAFYYAFGRDSLNPIPTENQAQHIRAFLAALEIAYERDWAIYKASFFFTSGDDDINDGVAKGFDGIVPNQQFAGGGFLGPGPLADRNLINPLFEGGGTNFLNRQLVPLTGTGVLLFGLNSLMPNMRPGLFQGQANFVNPGVMLANIGVDAKLTPKLRGTINLNYLRFHRTEVLEAVLFQSRIRKGIGADAGFGLQYRPKLSDNIVLTGGFGVLIPHAGFKDIYNQRTLLSAFIVSRFQF